MPIAAPSPSSPAAPAPAAGLPAGPDRSAGPGRAARQQRHGILLMIGAVTLFAGIDASAKFAGQHLPKIEVVWFRFALHLLLAMALLHPWRAPEAWVIRRPGLQILRALIQVGTTGLNFVALASLQLAESLTLQFIGPAVVTLLSVLLLGEKVSGRRWLAVMIGFVGVLLVTRPGVAAFKPAYGVMLLSVIIGAGYMLLTRKLALIESPGSLLLVMAGVPAVALLPVMPLVWVWPADWPVWLALLGAGICGAASHFLLILANARAPVSLLAPFQYLQLVASSTLGFVLFGDIPATATLAGAAVVIASGLYLWQLQRRGL